MKTKTNYYRTIHGVRYPRYLKGNGLKFMRRFTNTWVRYKKVGDDIFIHPEDLDKVQKLWVTD